MTPPTLPQRCLCLPGAIAPRAAIVVALAVCLAAMIFLVPDRRELFKRHLADGDEEAAAEFLERELGDDVSGNTAALTAEALRLCERQKWDEESVTLLSGFVKHNKNFQSAANEILRKIEDIPSRVRPAIFGVLVDRALADADLKFAETVQMKMLDSAKVLTPAIVRQAVKTFRYNNNPALALHTINQLEGTGKPLPEDLKELQVGLARETSQPEIAFALLEQQIRITDDPNELRRLIPNAIKTGVEAGKQNDLIPLYERYLADVPKPGGDRRDPLRDEYMLMLAKTYEWTAQPERAFDVYLELAGEGHRPSLERCMALNPGLYRTGDLLEMLVGARERYPDNESLQLLTARLLAEAARRDEAIALYKDHLERHPENAEARYRLGLVYDEMQEFEKALEFYDTAHSLDPDKLSYVEKAARIAVSLGQYDIALQRYRSLSAQSRDYEHAEMFHNLAKALGDVAAVKESYQLMISIGGPFDVSHRLSLAGLCRSMGDASGAIRTLEEAVKKYPKDDFIRVELAETYLAQKRPDRALSTLKSVSFSRHPFAAHATLQALGTLGSTSGSGSLRDYFKAFASRLESSGELQPGEVLQLAELFRRFGEPSRAARLFRRVVRDSDRPGELARAHFYLDQPKSARDYQLRHIRTSPRPSSDDYRMLGDIHALLNDRRSADSAYRKALALLRQQPRRR